MYNLGAVWDQDEPITFWGQKIIGLGHDKTRYGHKGALVILKVMGSKVEVKDDLSSEGIPIDSSPLNASSW